MASRKNGHERDDNRQNDHEIEDLQLGFLSWVHTHSGGLYWVHVHASYLFRFGGNYSAVRRTLIGRPDGDMLLHADSALATEALVAIVGRRVARRHRT
jgi:hypothetical protein